MAAVSRAPPMAWSIKAEGLGLGGIEMPVELGGSTQAIDPLPFEARYQALRTTSRHTPSQSSPPSLAPFVASLPTSKSSSSLSASLKSAPTPVTVRKHSLQNVSGDMISYPMISRIDLAPTYTAPSAPPPVPVEAKSDSHSQAALHGSPPEDAKKSAKARPPPIKLPTSNHGSFLSPFKSRFGGKEKETGSTKDRSSVDPREKVAVKSKAGKVEGRVHESNVVTASRQAELLVRSRSSPAVPSSTDDDDTLNITLPPKVLSATDTSTSLPLSTPSSQPFERSASQPERIIAAPLGSPFDPPLAHVRPSTPSQGGSLHRRGVSDQSPVVVQNAFARIAAGEKVDRARPATVYSATPATSRRPSHPSPSMTAASTRTVLQEKTVGPRRSSRSKSISSTAGLPAPEDAFFPPAVGAAALAAPSAPSAAIRRPSAVPREEEGVSAVGISVREGGAADVRELGRASFGDDGLSVSIRSYHRPDEVEVGWVCVPGIDDEGRQYTTWELRLRPLRTTRQCSTTSNGTVVASAAEPISNTPVRPRTMSTSSGSHFFNYRMNAPPPPPASVDGSGSPRSGQRRTTSVSPFREIPPPPRKLSSTRSDGSFSSESSAGPITPRRGKLSNASQLSNDHPPFDLDAVLASKPLSAIPPFSATSLSFDLDDREEILAGLPSPRRRTNRASSYALAEQNRARQFSIDEEGILNNRAASFSVAPGAPGAAGMPPKSPKHHRFACYIPPVGTGGVDFAGLVKEHKRRSQQSNAGESTTGGGRDEQPPVPSSQRQRKASVAFAPSTSSLPGSAVSSDGESAPPRSFLASRGLRKQSVAPPSALVIPPLPSALSASSIVSPPSASSTTAGLHPSPLRTPLPATTTLSASELPTPTRARYAASELPRGPSPIPIHLHHLQQQHPGLSHSQSSPASIASTTPPSPPPPPPSHVKDGPSAAFAAAVNKRGADALPKLLFPSASSPALLALSSLSSSSSGSSSSPFDPTILRSNVSSPTPSDPEDAEGADGEGDEVAKGRRLARKRQMKRLASKWSDTEDDEEASSGIEGESEAEGGTTSWSRVPDAVE